MNSKLRVLLLLILSLFAVPCARSQGKVVFQTLRASLPRIDAPATFAATGEPLGNGFFAQLYIGPAGSPVIQLKPQGPILPFVDGPRAGYIVPGREVVFQGFNPGVRVTI